MLHLDLIGDLKSVHLRELSKLGYAITATTPAFDVAIQYLNVQNRRISSKPRKVHKAQELTYDSTLAPIIQEITRKVQLGESLWQYQSKQILQSNLNDTLFNDWGINHLHVSDILESNGFMKRVSPLLFVFVTEDDFYMIKIMNHGVRTPNPPWADKNLLEVILKNWEFLLEPYGSDGWDSFDVTSEDEHLAFRKEKVNILIRLSNGKVYGQIGGGISATGSNIQYSREINRGHYLLKQVELYIKNNLGSFQSQIPSVSLHPLYKKSISSSFPLFQLAYFRDNQIAVAELHSKKLLRFSIENQKVILI